MQNPPDIIRKILNDVKIEAMDEFDRNFENKGFFDAGTWQKSKYNNPKGSLMLRTGKLRKSIRAEVRENSVVFTSSKAYASLHNEGGEIVVTEKMKKYFWAKHYELSGKVKGKTTKSSQKTNAQAEYYKSLALMKVGSKMTIPKRQFIGDHPNLTKRIEAIVSNSLETFFKDFLKTKK
jgi:phage gpG-like protein